MTTKNIYLAAIFIFFCNIITLILIYYKTSSILCFISFFFLLLFILIFFKYISLIQKEINASQLKNKNSDEALQKANDFLKNEKISVLSKFSSIVSHELKNNLSSLKNISYFLLKVIKSDDPKIKRMLDLLSSELDKINESINQLSSVSRISRVNKSLTNPAEPVNEALNNFKFNSNITVFKEIENCEANIDLEKFKYLITNLISNAQDAMTPDGGRLNITLKKLDKAVEITVQDTGIGMDNDVKEHAFEPMFTTKTKVLGMGLTVVKEIVNVHNGTINVITEKGKGSTFIVTIPV